MKAFAHHQEWVSALESLTPTAPHLMVICPPGHAKTTWMGIFNPAFQIGVDPNIHIGYISNSATQAHKQSIAVRDTLTTKEYSDVFPHIRPDFRKGWAKDKWYIARENASDNNPTFLAAGLFGPVLGARFDLLIMDDIYDEEIAYSEDQSKRARNWVRRTAMTRLKPEGHAICILTRWNPDDLAAEFMNDPMWNVVHMPAIGYFSNGTALWPEWFPIDRLLIEQARDPIAFETIYQGNPTVEEGQIIKRDWWKWTTEDSFPSLNSFDLIVQAWDTAFKVNADADYSVCITAGRYKGNIYILDVFREKVEWPELLKASRRLYGKYLPSAVLIEDAASGQSLIQSLQLDIQPMIPVVPSKRGDSDTESFVRSKTAWIPRIWLKKNSPEANRLVSECSQFPRGKDDQVLALCHLLKYITAGLDAPPLDDSMFVQGSRQFQIGHEDSIEIDSGGGSSCSFSFGRESTSWREPWTN